MLSWCFSLLSWVMRQSPEPQICCGEHFVTVTKFVAVTKWLLLGYEAITSATGWLGEEMLLQHTTQILLCAVCMGG